MSLVKSDEEQRWVPTHVQVTVLRARGLRAKGKHGTSDVYTIIQLGKEKYSTCVMEKTTDPEWGEECAFELQPGILEEGGRDAYPPGTGDLTLTVMHRALIGLDVFLGQAVIPLDKAFQDKICKKNQWYRLHSKSGKKEKERGELQLILQFTRHNLTASMYDLSTKDKPRSAFDKLRERMRAKKQSSKEDSSSAIVPGGYGSLVRMRGRLPSDGGGEEDYEDDEGGEARRSKMRSFFLRGRLRKSSDTRSSTSLGSESSESSRGGSLSPTAGISVVVSDLSNSPSNSSNLTADSSPDHTVAPSPQVSPVRHVHANDMCDFSLPVPHSVTSENDTPILLPSVCINGNPVETSPLTHHPPLLILQQPHPGSTKPVTQSGQPQATKLPAKPQNIQSSKPNSQPSAETKLSKSESKPRPEPQLPALGLIQKGSSLSISLQNLSRRGEEKQSGGPMDGRRWSFDKPGEEEKAAIVAALEYAGRVTDESVMETVIPVGETQSKKRRGLFSHGRGEPAGKGPITSKEEAEHAQQLVEVKHKGWFSSKDSHSKPSPLVSSKSDFTGSTICPIVPFKFSDPLQNMADKHTNPFTPPPPVSEANPFLPLVQQNPFLQESPSDAPLTPTVPSLSSSAHYQSESASSWIGGNLTPDLLRIGNMKGPSGISQIDGSVDSFSSHLEAQMEKDDFGKFAEDRLKSSEEENETQNLVTTPTVPMKPNNPEPLGVLGDLTVLDTNDLTYLGKTASAGTSTGEMSKETAANTPQVSGSEGNSNSNKPDFTSPGAFDFTQFGPNISEISLPENPSAEFSELNALASPFPAQSTASQNEVNADATTSEESPKTFLTSQDDKSSVTQPSVSEEDILCNEHITSELSEDVHVSPETSQRPEALEFTRDMESVKAHEDPTACNKGYGSGDTPEPSSVTSDSQGRELHQSIELCHSPQSDLILNNMKQLDEGFLELNASPIQSTDPSGVHSPSAPSSPMSTDLPVQVKKENLNVVNDTKLQNKPEDVLSDGLVKTSDLCSENEGSIPGNQNDITSSPGLSKTMSNDMQVGEVCDISNNLSRDGDPVSGIGEGHEMMQSDGETFPVEHLNPTTGDKTGIEDPFSPKSAVSTGNVPLHSLYKSADSDQYLTCVSQQDFIFSCLELTQEVKPKHDKSGEDTLQFGPLPEHVTVHNFMPKDDTPAKAIKEMDCERRENLNMVEHFKPQEDLPKKESPQENVLLSSCNKDIPEHDLPKDVMSKIDISKDLIAELEAQLAPLKTETHLVDNCETCPTKLDSFHSLQIDSLIAETFGSVSEVKFNSAQNEQNVWGSDCASEQTSSITQDPVITDFHLENVFVPQPIKTHNLYTGVSPVINTESAWTQNDFKPAESLNRNNEIHITPAVPDSVTPGLFPVNWPPLSQPFPTAFDQPTLANNFPSSVFDLSPVASSTPHVAVDNNVGPQLFPFPKSEDPWSVPAAPLPSPQAASVVIIHNPFLQDKSQTTNHQCSPYPVKPLTPPDDKRSEGRSVLEKLKSTVHSGRSHQSDQDSDKKLLVEGGGSYYHLSHNELVNLLIQRDTELKQEREEFERRGALLEKREVELKKMKVCIRDLEDYIDTLLVRIMEQTPTLLQVRSKMK